MHTTTSKQISDHLLRKYQCLYLKKHIVSYEMGIEESTLNLRISKGIGLPPYLKIGNQKNSKVLFNIHDLAYFLASDTNSHLTIEARRKYIYDFLLTKFSRMTIGRKEFSSLIGVDKSTIGEYMKKNIFSNYSKHGKSKNARVSFCIIDIANDLSNVIETM